MEDNENKVKKTTTRKKKIEAEKVVSEEIDEIPEVKELIVEKNGGFNYAEVIVIMIITLILGGIAGSFITYVTKDNNEKTKSTIKNSASSTKTLPKEFDELVDAYENIINGYYEDVDKAELIEAGINGMLEYLGDDYSNYMNKEISEKFNEQVEGKYKGIGVEILLQQDKSIVINRVFSGSPAKEAGLQPGDVFVSVDGESVEGKNPSDVSTMIRNRKNGKVTVVVNRDGKEETYNLSLEEVNIESVETKVFEENGKKIGYIELSVFAANTYTQFEKKLLELESKGIDSLIIDVRSNSGGYLATVTDIASLFLPKSKVIYQLDTKGVIEQIYATTRTSRNYDIVVLIDGASASASEILTAALQESYGATVIGTNSFGKGTVQTLYQLESGATVKYTIQKWLTPNGNWINEVGVTPDIKEELSEEYFKNPSDETDNQLQKALEELSK